MKKSITKKMILVFFLFLCILMAGNALMNLMFFKNFKLWQNERRMIAQGETIARHLEDTVMNRKNLKNYADEVLAVTQNYNLTIRIVNKNYDVLLDSNNFHYGSRSKLPMQLIDQIEKHKEDIASKEYSVIISNRQESGNPHILYVRKLNDDYLLTISRTLKSIDEDIETSNIFLLISGSIVAVLGIFIIYLFSKSFTKPILAINHVAQRISHLDFSAKVSVQSQDELGELAGSMNLISDKLSESITELKTDLDKRNQLVRDLSHELKTPITAIKGYSEALKYGICKDPEKIQQYHNIIVQECDRMNSLIYEMIELSKMESLADVIHMESFCIQDVIERLEQQYHYEMEKKQITLELNLEQPMITGDSNLIERAVKNLIENAVHYMRPEGKIVVSGCCRKQQYILTVFNTGSSIPEESIQSIWDVFYKVDESRKRENNTYGIGLAIVKSAIELHHGHVEVENKEDGVEFRLYLPQQENLT